MYCILTFITFSQQLLHFSCFLNLTSTTSHKQLLAWNFLISRLFTVFLHFYQLCLDFISSHSGFNLQLDQILPDPILLGRFFLIRILVADIFRVKFWLISSILQKFVWSWHTAMPNAMLTNIKYIQPCQLRSFQNGWKLPKQQQSLRTWWYLPAVECGKTILLRPPSGLIPRHSRFHQIDSWSKTGTDTADETKSEEKPTFSFYFPWKKAWQLFVTGPLNLCTKPKELEPRW